MFYIDMPALSCDTRGMNSDARKDVRFSDIGRVDAPDICALPGVLDDISSAGCKVHFPIPVVFDMDNDYELKVRPTRIQAFAPFILMCHPQWKRDTEGQTEVGFKVLRSPGTPQLTAYIAQLHKENVNAESVQDLIVDPKCQFI